MRTIRLKRSQLHSGLGRTMNIPVIVDWSELRLTQEQVMVNAVARAFDKPLPYVDNSIFEIEIDNDVS